MSHQPQIDYLYRRIRAMPRETDKPQPKEPERPQPQGPPIKPADEDDQPPPQNPGSGEPQGPGKTL